MGTYIHFTDEQKERANSVDLEEFLRQRGEKLLRAGRESRLARVHHITVRGNEWYDHIARQGGHAVSFVQHYYGMSYQEAMELLLGNELGATYPAAEPKREEPPKPFALPPPNADMRRVYAYLMKQRRVSREWSPTSPGPACCTRMLNTTTASLWARTSMVSPAMPTRGAPTARASLSRSTWKQQAPAQLPPRGAGRPALCVRGPD